MQEKINAFELFINTLLQTHHGREEIKHALSNSSLHSSVDKFLFESQIQAFFIPDSSVDNVTFKTTMNKLHKLQKTLNKAKKTDTDAYLILDIIILKYSEQNVLLSKEILLYLNKLYRDGIS